MAFQSLLFRAGALLWWVMLCLESLASPPTTGPHPVSYRAIHYGIDEGLRKETWHTSMIRDIHGFLWLGTPHGELCRFDSFTFRQYYGHSNGSKSIRNTSCLNFIEDSLNNIWIGTLDGLSRYDIKADTFTHFGVFRDSLNQRSGIVPFWATSTEVYCLEGRSFLTAYNIRSLNRGVLMPVRRTDLDRSNGLVQYTIYDQLNNSVWMLSSEGEGLVQYTLTTQQVIYHKRPLYKKSKSDFRHFNSEAMRLDPKRNCIWINSSDGLSQFTLADHQFHRIEALNTLSDRKDYDRWVGIDIDIYGRVWFATLPYGLIIFDPDSHTFTFPELTGATAEEVSAGNLKIYCDREGMVWLSFWNIKGIYQLVPYTPVVNRYEVKPSGHTAPAPTRIQNMLPGDRGKLWVGTDRGLFQFDSGTKNFSLFREADLPGLAGEGIVPMHLDPMRNKAWLNASPPDRVYVMDMKTYQCKPIQFKDVSGKALTPVNIINFLCLDFDPVILFFDAGHGIFELHKDSLEARLVIHWKISDYGLILKMIKGEGQKFYLRAPLLAADESYELIKGQWEKSVLPDVLSQQPWNDLLYDETDKTYWVAGDNHLSHYDHSFQLIRRYGEESGILSEIISIVPDGRGKIWFNKDRKSIGSVDVQSGLITLLDESDGYTKIYFTLEVPHPVILGHAVYYTGSYLSQDYQVLDQVIPEHFVSSPPASVYFKSLNINQAPYAQPVHANDIKSLSLRYFENLISLETGIINFYSRGKSSLRYKLEGGSINEGWQFAPYYYTIRYEGLPPGKYILTMQASNASNEFNGPLKTLNILISPPFWETWWFRVLAGILFFTGLYFLFQYRSRQLRERNVLLEHKIQERTSALNESLVELKNTQEQLIQSEKMASLGELTSGIAHEIKNPLNFINNFSELNMELIHEVDEDFTPKMEKSEQAGWTHSIKTLKKNSEKINHHGKRIDEIVKGMLAHSRTGNIKKEPVQINALCEDALKLAYHGFRAKEKPFHATCETRLEANIPVVMVIPQEISRVMLNLINNAFYAVHIKMLQSQKLKEEDSLQMETRYEPSVILSTHFQGNKVSIMVSDNGTGIPDEVIGKVFQPFFTTKPTGEGTGLGLSIAYDIVTKGHGGELKVKSKSGIGTDFEMILPVTAHKSTMPEPPHHLKQVL